MPNPQQREGPFHYCPQCQADSLFAPMPVGAGMPGYTQQAYACGGTIHYRPDWSVAFRWSCGTFEIAPRVLKHTRKFLVDNSKDQE